MHVYGDEIPDGARRQMRYLHNLRNAARFHLFHYGIDENLCQGMSGQALCVGLCAASGGSGIDCAAGESRRVNRSGTVNERMGSLREQAGEG